MKNSKGTITDIEKRLSSITDYVSDCRSRVTKGEIMDLKGLDNTMIEICDQLAELPEKESRSLEKQMSRLISSLEELARTMKDQQEGLSSKTGAG